MNYQFLIPDNLDLFASHDAAQEQQLRELPQCSCCDCYIQEEKAVCVDGKWFCKDCEGEAWELVKNEYLESTEK